MRNSRRLTLALAASGALVFACDSPVSPPIVGSVAPRIQLVQPHEGASKAVLTTVRAIVTGGGITRTATLTLNGGFWTGRIDSLPARAYTLVLEGLEGTEIEYFGQASVNVVAGATATPTVPFGTVKTTVKDILPAITSAFSVKVEYARIAPATGYVVQYSASPTFATGITEQATTDTFSLVTVSDVGTYHVRTRSTVPNASSALKWSDTKTFEVVDGGGGRTVGGASVLTLVSGVPDTVRNHNITPAGPEGWYSFDARAGDTINVKTVAGALQPPSNLNTVISIFRTDGTTLVASNDNAASISEFRVGMIANADASTDSRIVTVLPATETFRLRVTGAGGTVGHYMLVSELRRLPAAPSTLTAVTASGSRVDLAWTDNSDNETGFSVERCAGAGCTNFAEITLVDAGINGYSDTDVTVGQVYSYRVRARNAIGTSAFSNTASASTTAPNAASGLTATTVSGSQIDLAWTDNSSDETGFRVERCAGVGCTDFAEVASVGADVVTYSNVGLTLNTTYSYRVIAFNVAAGASPTTTATANTIVPGAPSDLAATTMSATQIDLSWTDNTTNETSFRVEQCEGVGCTVFTEVATVAANVTAYQVTGIATTNSYTFRVRAMNAAGPSPYSGTATATTFLPLAASGLTATTSSGTTIELAWTDNANNELSYRIERCAGAACATFAEIAFVNAGVVAYQDATALPNTSYSYRIVARNNVGDASPSNEATANTLIPAAPSGLSATTLSANQIDLAWTDNSSNETGFTIERCEGASCSSFVVVTTVGADVVTFSNTGLTADASYTYRVRAINISGLSDFSNEATATTFVPASPTTLTAIPTTATQINLGWADQSANEDGFRIERCTGAGCTDFVEIAATGPNVFVYPDPSVSAATSYTYRVRAFNSSGNSAFSNEATTITAVPDAPTGLVGTPISAVSIDLAWTDNASNEVGYRVERCTGLGCSTFAEITVTGANSTGIQDGGLTTDETYTYRVQAFNAVGTSTYSNVVTVTLSVPAAPSGLTATTFSASQINLSWTDNSDTETGYLIERCDDPACSDFAQIASVGVNVGTYQDNAGIVLGQSYTYRIRASNAVGNSLYSGEATATTLLPVAPSTLVASTVSATQVDLTWVDNSDNELGFEVERCAGAACSNFTQVALIGPNLQNYENTGLTPSTEYRYRVRAVNAAGPSSYSNEDDAATNLPADPTSLVATAAAADQINLTWADNATNEDGYIVERCEGLGCSNFAAVASLSPNIAAYADPGLQGDFIYSYRVQAFNGNGSSRYSNVASAITSGPPAPTSLTAATFSGSRIDLAWTDNSDNEVSFLIERCAGVGCSSFAQIASVSVSSYQDASVALNETYTYRVRAANAVSMSTYTNDATANTILPADPTAISATTISSAQIQVAWTDNAGNELGYRIERCAGVGCSDFSMLVSLGADANQHQDMSVTSGESYTYRVAAFNDAGSSNFTSEATATTLLPNTPTDPGATTVTASRVDVTWTDNANNEAGFRIERCAGAGCGSNPANFAEIATVGANLVTFPNEGLTGNTFYSYRVRAYNAAGVSAYTTVVSASTFLPAAPTTLAATTMLAGRIDLAWADPANNESGFRVERCTGAACTDFLEIATTGANTTGFQDLTVTLGNAYRYRARSFNGVGNSAFSNIADANTNFVPADPTALNAVANGQSQIDLSWTDNSGNETGFRIERCTGAGCSDFAEITIVGADVTAFANSGLSASESYSYRVRAYNNGTSAYTNTATATTILPAAPTTLSAVSISPTVVDLVWTDNADNEFGYQIERCAGPSCSSFALIFTTAADATTYQDAGLSVGESYTYRVRAQNGAGVSAFTNEASTATNVPEIPTALSATTISSTQINLSWSDNAGNETAYHVERCTGPACLNFAEIQILAADATNYSDTPAAGSVYRYRVRASNAGGNSGYSNVASAGTNAPADPTSLTATTISATRIDLAWADNADNELQYVVERCTGAGCSSFAEVAPLAAGTTSHSDLTVTLGNSYSYRVRAVNAAFPSGYTNTATATTIVPADPTLLAADAISASQIDLSWTDNANNEVTYHVERCAGTGCGATPSNFVEIVTLPANATSYPNSGLAAETDYSYRIRAVNAAGESQYSNVATATTSIPVAPSGLNAVTINATEIALSWTDNAINETGYLIERCVGAGCAGTESNFASLVTMPVDATVFTDFSATLGNSYTYRIRATGATGDSPFSNMATATTLLPSDPTTLTAATVAVTPQIDVSWTDNSDNEAGFLIEACSTQGCSGFTQIDSVGPNVTTFGHTAGVVLGEFYTYRVRAVNAAGTSGYTNSASANTFVPANPTALSAITASASQINLSWTDNSDNEQGFRVEFCATAACSDFTLIETLAPGATAYAHTGLVVSQSYSYRVIAFNAIGNSAAYTNEATATTFPPTAPASLTATTMAGNRIDLSWTDLSNNELGFRIERCAGNACANFDEITVVPAELTAYSDMTVSLNTTYTYRVRSYNNVTPSTYTNEASANTNLPTPPTTLNVTPVTGQRIDLSWNDNSDNEARFSIERCAGLGCSNFAEITTVGPDVESYSDVSVAFNTVYGYRVRALNIAGQSDPAGPLSGSTVLNAPTSGRSFTIGRNAIRIRWDDNSTIETGYAIERCAGDGCSSFALIQTVAANDTSFSNGGLTPNTEYSYRVRAVTTGGASAYTGNAGARTPRVMISNTTVLNLADTVGGERHFVINVPAGATTLTVTMNSPAGNDPDMYVRRGAVPIAFQTAGAPNDTLCVPFTGALTETCTFNNPAPGDYYVMVQGFSAYSGTSLSFSIAPNSFTLTPCGATGANGPSAFACALTYSGTPVEGKVTVLGTSGIQEFTVPYSGTYRITTIGAQGASGENVNGWVGGRGAHVRGEFNLTAGTKLRVVVGQMGLGQSSGSNGGGGGGTFVVDVLNNPLIIAGGGGGTRTLVTQNGCNASTTTFAGLASGSLDAWGCPLKADGVTLGGIMSSASWGSGGAGFAGDGAQDFDGFQQYGTGGRSWTNGMTGGSTGTTPCSFNAQGGFGGGGAGNGCNGGGGGGGYSGGDGGRIAGGGASFNSGSARFAIVNPVGGNGSVTIQWVSPTTP
jgi:hypothetical protein